MRCTAEKGNRESRTATLSRKYGKRNLWKFHYTLNFMITISIALFGTNTFSGGTSNIRGVQIELGGGNRICMSFEGEIKGIIINGDINLPGNTFKNITKVGNTKISRSHSGMLTRIGHVGIHRDWHGNIIKIGKADILRNRHGSIIAVDGDPHISPLFAVNPP